MEFTEYQRRAEESDVSRDAERDRIFVPLLGLSGEAGTLLTEFKKKYRDGDAYHLFDARITEELGDILWYLSTIASRCRISLEDIAQYNLTKNSEQWLRPDNSGLLPFAHTDFFDGEFPPSQQLPRTATYTLIEDNGQTLLFFNDAPYAQGDRLTDNVWTNDGYRYHDVFHLAFATVLRWSPITRRILNCKRKRNEAVDEIEDGGRAGVIEEAVVALVFDYARTRKFLVDATEIDYDILRTIRQLTQPYEVRRWSTGLWQDAILQGFAVWREINDAHGGRVVCNAIDQRLAYEPVS